MYTDNDNITNSVTEMILWKFKTKPETNTWTTEFFTTSYYTQHKPTSNKGDLPHAANLDTHVCRQGAAGALTRTFGVRRFLPGIPELTHPWSWTNPVAGSGTGFPWNTGRVARPPIAPILFVLRSDPCSSSHTGRSQDVIFELASPTTAWPLYNAIITFVARFWVEGRGYCIIIDAEVGQTGWTTSREPTASGGCAWQRIQACSGVSPIQSWGAGNVIGCSVWNAVSGTSVVIARAVVSFQRTRPQPCSHGWCPCSSRGIKACNRESIQLTPMPIQRPRPCREWAGSPVLRRGIAWWWVAIAQTATAGGRAASANRGCGVGGSVCRSVAAASVGCWSSGHFDQPSWETEEFEQTITAAGKVCSKDACSWNSPQRWHYHSLEKDCDDKHSCADGNLFQGPGVFLLVSCIFIFYFFSSALCLVHQALPLLKLSATESEQHAGSF